MLISHVNEGRVVLHHVSYSRVKGLIICKTHCNSFFLGSFFEVPFTRPIAGRGGASGGDWGLGVVLAESVSGSLLSVHVSTRKGRSQKAETQGGFRCKQIMSLCTVVHSRKRNCGVDFFRNVPWLTLRPWLHSLDCLSAFSAFMSGSPRFLVGDVKWMICRVCCTSCVQHVSASPGIG